MAGYKQLAVTPHYIHFPYSKSSSLSLEVSTFTHWLYHYISMILTPGLLLIFFLNAVQHCPHIHVDALAQSVLAGDSTSLPSPW
jgi:hypothetical protein